MPQLIWPNSPKRTRIWARTASIGPIGVWRSYEADAQSRYAEDQTVLISAQREQARLDVRTREVDAAKGQVALARAEGAEQRS
jgi:hypothetical protein